MRVPAEADLIVPGHDSPFKSGDTFGATACRGGVGMRRSKPSSAGLAPGRRLRGPMSSTSAGTRRDRVMSVPACSG
ncbi:hypothetical protein GCM10010347_42920 [Streptomyces cirratus]|uniref:Uncharacterized protein n=1 Tax=Streptomyces cirratus TaxID=68187 RepID=A0ABQ3EYB5_9ACTN|nr:hypothetical protein GCM10010347_42920 [Streptomyces cirratus]